MTEKDIKICGHGSGNPSLKNMHTYNAMRYSQKMADGTPKGVVEVRRPKGMTDEMRKKYVEEYTKILGRNIYSNNLRQYVFTPYKNGKYYSDCSSSQAEALRRVGISIGILNTRGIHESDKFETLPVKIVAGHVMNPEILKVGDQILYAGNADRPMKIGHVEGVYSVPEEKKPEPTPVKEVVASRGAKSKDTSLKGTYKTTGSLHLRDGAGVQYKSLAIMPKGQRVKMYGWYTPVLGRKWFYVQTTLDGVKYTGFCSSKYLTRV